MVWETLKSSMLSRVILIPPKAGIISAAFRVGHSGVDGVAIGEGGLQRRDNIGFGLGGLLDALFVVVAGRRAAEFVLSVGDVREHLSHRYERYRRA